MFNSEGGVARSSSSEKVGADGAGAAGAGGAFGLLGPARAVVTALCTTSPPTLVAPRPSLTPGPPTCLAALVM